MTIISLGFCGILYDNHNKEPRNGIGNDLGPYTKPYTLNFVRQENSGTLGLDSHPRHHEGPSKV